MKKLGSITVTSKDKIGSHGVAQDVQYRESPRSPGADHPNRAVGSCNRRYMPTNHVKFLGITSLRVFKYALSILGAHQYLF
jgi:hypothetical protein